MAGVPPSTGYRGSCLRTQAVVPSGHPHTSQPLDDASRRWPEKKLRRDAGRRDIRHAALGRAGTRHPVGRFNLGALLERERTRRCGPSRSRARRSTNVRAARHASRSWPAPPDAWRAPRRARGRTPRPKLRAAARARRGSRHTAVSPSDADGAAQEANRR